MNDVISVPQWVVNALLVMAVSGISWAIGRLQLTLKDLQKADKELTDHVHDLAVVVAGLQQFQEDSKQFRVEALDKLAYIITRLDMLSGAKQ